jgi:hypothetical protein
VNDLDQKILAMLVDDGRMSFADIARELGSSRVHARDRVQRLIEASSRNSPSSSARRRSAPPFRPSSASGSIRGIEMVAEDLLGSPRSGLYIMAT